MTQENYVKMLISNSGHTIKSFAESIDLPYTTLLGMLNRGLSGASVQNVIKVCKGLSITIEDLERIEGDQETHLPFYISEHEKLLVTRYRENLEMQPAINLLLGIEKSK